MLSFKKILIANRGEIALRIVRACKELGISCVCVHSTADNDAMHVRLADESVCVGPPPAKKSYLNILSILSAAELSGADAIHPGFGFLSENDQFASLVEQHGMVFIGPKAQHIHIMGHKVTAKKMAVELGLKTVPGSIGEITSLEEGLELGEQIGYPLLIKATAGGGGKGMRVVAQPSDFSEALSLAQNEALSNFGNGGVYIEKYLSNPRHIEVQILGDHYGQVVCLGSRDCSLQRRHQKIWEEAPAFSLTPQEHTHLLEISQKAMQKFGYRNAGTLEFLYEDGQFYFIEMNTRLQVEHPITEMISGIDIVKQQILIAQGLPLSFAQEDLVFKGHSIECRINAENPDTFLPSPGCIIDYLAPGGPFVRVDSALFPGYRVPSYYDSLVSKLIVYGQTREECLHRLERALREYVITGIETLIPFHIELCHNPDITQGNYDIKWIEKFLKKK